MRTFKSTLRVFLGALLSFSLGMNAAHADPPAWAPAHGYYKNKHKNKHEYKTYHDENDYREPRYESRRRYEPLQCVPYATSNADIGTVVGGIIGGILGSNVGKGKGKTLATIAGVMVGATIGNSVGEAMDDADKYCAGQAFSTAQDSQSVAWVNPDTQRRYTVTPNNSYTRDNGRYCRDYTSSVVINGEQRQATGTACKDNSGNWQIIN